MTSLLDMSQVIKYPLKSLKILAHVQAAFYAVFYGPENTTVMVSPSDFSWDGEAYTAAAVLNTTGVYQVVVMRGSAHVRGSPLQVQVLAGSTSAAMSQFLGTALDTIVAGLPANVTVQVKPFAT